MSAMAISMNSCTSVVGILVWEQSMFVMSGMVSTYAQRSTELLFCESPINSFYTCRWGEWPDFCSFVNFIFNYVVRYIRFVISGSSYCYCIIWCVLGKSVSFLCTTGVMIGHEILHFSKHLISLAIYTRVYSLWYFLF